jgi:hypothetical protein
MMLRDMAICFLLGISSFQADCQLQTTDSVTVKPVDFPSKFFSRIQGKATVLDQRLMKQTEKDLQKMKRWEAKLKKNLSKIDPTAANNLFNNSTTQQYANLARQLEKDSGVPYSIAHVQYLANLDSEKVSLSYLEQHLALLGNKASLADVQKSLGQIQQLQAKFQTADAVQAFVCQRKEQIKEYLSRLTNLPQGLSKAYEGLNRDQYYYRQQLEQYRDILNDPDKLFKKVLTLLDQLPTFRQFMQNNSQLTVLFGAPGVFGTPQALAGLQTRDQLQQLIQRQLSSGGDGAMAAMQQDFQSAQFRLDQYKDKLTKFGSGGGDVDIPDFKPNNEKKKSFLGRLEFGTNIQTTNTNYYPTTTDLGISVGYKLNDNNSVGVGASYKLGWGTGFGHMALSSSGIGLRSFIDIRVKGSISATGGLEYNHETPFNSLQQLKRLSDWTQSGLIGLTKTISVKSRAFKKTTLQLLWDFLSYQQVPETQPILFRIGYSFK